MDHNTAFHLVSDPNDPDNLCSEIIDCVNQIADLKVILNVDDPSRETHSQECITASQFSGLIAQLINLFHRYQQLESYFKCSLHPVNFPPEIQAFIITYDHISDAQRRGEISDGMDVVHTLLCNLNRYRSSTHGTDNSQRRSHDQNQSLSQYIDALFNRYSRLLVIRVDCSYTKETRHGNFELARTHRKRFFTLTPRHPNDPDIFEHRVGFCWKLEWGLEKLLHYHMLLFYDGSKVREDITLADRLAVRWNWIVATTPSYNQLVLGSTFNCNQYAFNHHRNDPNNALGMVAHNDTKRQALQKVIEYLTKPNDQVFPEGYRTFGRGGMPEHGSRRGRPRQNPTSLV